MKVKLLVGRSGMDGSNVAGDVIDVPEREAVALVVSQQATAEDPKLEELVRAELAARDPDAPPKPSPEELETAARSTARENAKREKKRRRRSDFKPTAETKPEEKKPAKTEAPKKP